VNQTTMKSTTDSISRSIQNCIHQNFPRAKQQNYSMSADLFESGIIDSLGFLTIISFIEQHFNTTISDVDVVPENFASIKAMTGYVERKLNQR